MRYAVGLVRRQLNSQCLIGVEIVTRRIGETGFVSRVLSWDDIKLTRLIWNFGFVLPSSPFFFFPFSFCLNRLSTERCRRCPDAGVGWGFRWGIFGLGFPRPCGGRVSLRSYMEPRNNPWEVHPNWEQSVTPICCTR